MLVEILRLVYIDALFRIELILDRAIGATFLNLGRYHHLNRRFASLALTVTRSQPSGQDLDWDKGLGPQCLDQGGTRPSRPGLDYAS